MIDAKHVALFHEKVTPEPNTGCWLWTGATTRRGYGAVRIGGETLIAPRVAWEIHHGAHPGGLFVLHKCDTTACVNPRHLFLGTHADNMADKTAKGRQGRGARVRKKSTKLTPVQVAEIRDAYGKGGVLQRDLAARYGVAVPTISEIIRQHRWREP